MWTYLEVLLYPFNKCVNSWCSMSANLLVLSRYDTNPCSNFWLCFAILCLFSAYIFIRNLSSTSLSQLLLCSNCTKLTNWRLFGEGSVFSSHFNFYSSTLKKALVNFCTTIFFLFQLNTKTMEYRELSYILDIRRRIYNNILMKPVPQQSDVSAQLTFRSLVLQYYCGFATCVHLYQNYKSPLVVMYNRHCSHFNTLAYDIHT